MTYIKERVLQIAEKEGITKERFFSVLGFSYGNFKGKSIKSALSSESIVEILSKYPNYSSDWLLTGKGSMYREGDTIVSGPMEKYSSKPTNIIEINPKYKDGNTLIADVKASAGFGLIPNEEKKLEELPSIHIPNAPMGLNIAFQINGDSMHPTVGHLDFVAGNRLYDYGLIRDGFTYVLVDVDDGVLCKRLYKMGNDYEIVSDNPDYKPYKRRRDEIVQVYKAFCKFSFSFRSFYDDLRGEVRDLRREMEDLKREVIKS